MQLKLRILLLPILAIILSFITTFAYGQATVTTDKEDYIPGETVIITGEGWEPGEQIKLEIDHSTVTHGNTILYAIADENGHIYNNEFVIQLEHWGEAFTLTASGQRSGSFATTTFTDGIKTWTGTISNDWGTANNWSPSGVPSSLNNDDVTIPTNPLGGRFPTISSGSFTVRDLNIQTGATLTQTGGSIEINRSFINSGTFTPTGGTFRYNGSSDQTILGITYYNLTLSGSGTKKLVVDNNNKTITVAGNFSFNNGTFILVDNNGNGTLNVAGNFLMSGGMLEMKKNNGAALINIAGNFTQDGGTFNQRSTSSDNSSLHPTSKVTVGGNFVHNNGTYSLGTDGLSSTSTLSSALYITGNFSHTGGSITKGSYGGLATIFFNGNAIQTYTSGATGNFTGAVNFNVQSGATLYFGTSLLGSNSSGSSASTGTFTLSSGATLGIGHAQGITTSDTTGNVSVTGTRSYNTGANYIYNGTASQVTGNGLPSSVNNLTTNNTSGVTLTSLVTVNGTLTLTNGIVTTTSANILTAIGSINGGSSSSYVNGPLARRYSAQGSKDFPIGKGGNYRPLTLNYTVLSGTSTVTAEQFETGFGGTFPSGTTALGTRFWRVTQSGGSSFTYAITLDGTGTSPAGDVKILKYNAPSSNTLFVTTGTAPNHTASGLTSFSDFALGEESCNTSAPTGTATQSFCNAATVADLQASGTAIQWYSASSGGTALASTTALVDGNTYHASQTVSGCESSSRLAVTVTISQQPTTANAGANATICSSGSQVLAANTPSVGTGAWTVYSGPSTASGQFSSTTSPTASFTPAGGAGSYVLRWTISNAPCAASTSDVTITVNQTPSINSVTNASQTVQYSDPIANVLITGTPSSATASAQTKKGSGSFIAGLPSGLTLVSNNNGTWTISGKVNVEPAVYTIRVTLDNATCSAFTDIILTVNQENAKATYTGALFVSTSSATSSTATVTLSATIQDITAVAGDPNYDADAGDIRNARVKFVNRDNGQDISGWLTPGLVSSGDLKTGTVTFNWSVNIGNANSQTYTVGIIVNSYYIRNTSNDNETVTVSKPLSDFITGGGFINLSDAAGLIAPKQGTKNNFGFNVKYNKSGTNLQGSINTIVRSENGKVYQVKGNVMTSLAANASNKTATFNGKASIQDITDPANPQPVDGNATLQVTMTDAGEPGTSDKISITVWNKAGGLWFASNWNGTKTVEQLLAKGNLKVSSNSSFGTVATTQAMARAELTVDQMEEARFNLQVFPNPTQSNFNVHIESSNIKDRIEVKVIDIYGRVVEVRNQVQAGSTIVFGSSYHSGIYFAEVMQGTNRKTIKLIKQ